MVALPLSEKRVAIGEITGEYTYRRASQSHASATSALFAGCRQRCRVPPWMRPQAGRECTGNALLDWCP